MYFQSKNQKRFLSNFNPVLLLIFVFALILVRTTSEPLLSAPLRRWDILLPVVTYIGQRRALVEGLALTILVSHLYSVCSSAPFGVYVLHYFFVFLVAHAVSSVLYANRPGTILLLLLGLGFMSRISAYFIGGLFGVVPGFFGEGFGIVLNLLLNCGAGFLVYLCIGLLDRMTFKVPMTRFELSER